MTSLMWYKTTIECATSQSNPAMNEASAMAITLIFRLILLVILVYAVLYLNYFFKQRKKIGRPKKG